MADCIVRLREELSNFARLCMTTESGFFEDRLAVGDHLEPSSLDGINSIPASG